MNTRKEKTKQQILCTDKVIELRLSDKYNDRSLAEALGISRQTLYTRLERSNWKKPEVALINKLKIPKQ